MYPLLMAAAKKTHRPSYSRTYIRAWREWRGLTLKELAMRMESSPGEELISSVSIGRIERGLQPYTQPVLEALAIALDCTAWELLEVNPAKEGAVVDLMRVIRGLDSKSILQMAKIAKAIA